MNPVRSLARAKSASLEDFSGVTSNGMKVHRFIIDIELRAGNLKLEDTELFNQFRNVLKLKTGEKIIICDGRGNEGMAEISGYGKNSISVEVGGISINQNESEKNVIIYCSILKRENFELVVQKATEIGVKEIVPLITARTVKLDIRKDRLEKIIKEAAEQSGRGMVPVLRDPANFEDVVKDIDNNGTNFIFNISGESFENLKFKIENYPLGVWVGPEGGWTEKELELVGGSNFKIVSLGRLTLRAETAAIVGAYLAIHSI